MEKCKIEEVKHELTGEEEDTTSPRSLDSYEEPSSWRAAIKIRATKHREEIFYSEGSREEGSTGLAFPYASIINGQK